MNEELQGELKAAIRTLIRQGRFAMGSVGCLYYDPDYATCCIVGLWLRDAKKASSDLLSKLSGGVSTAAGQYASRGGSVIDGETQVYLSTAQMIHDKAAGHAYDSMGYQRNHLMPPAGVCKALERGIVLMDAHNTEYVLPGDKFVEVAAIYREVIQEFQ